LVGGNEARKRDRLNKKKNKISCWRTISMDASALLWERWKMQVKELFPKIHGHQKKTLALCVMGIVLAGSAVLQRMAEGISLQGINPAKMTSIERRLARFIANDRVVVSQIWQDFLSQVLPFWQGKPLRFVLDGTPFRDDATIVYLGLLVHSRVLPVAWAVMPGQEKWQEPQWSIVARLLDQIIPHLQGADCTLIADRGLAGFPLVKICRDRRWHYLLRLSKQHTCQRKMGQGWSAWCRFDVFVHKTGQQWYGWAKVWQEDTLETYVSACWMPEYEEGWMLISDHKAGKRRVNEYALRMRVESTFQDSKSRGWNLEASWVKEEARLDRLLLALFVAMWWVSHLAASCMHHGQRDRFDRHDRRDKGIFRLGHLWLLDILRRTNNQADLVHCLPFRKLATGWHFSLRF
jgi:Transposase DDE domain